MPPFYVRLHPVNRTRWMSRVAVGHFGRDRSRRWKLRLRGACSGDIEVENPGQTSWPASHTNCKEDRTSATSSASTWGWAACLGPRYPSSLRHDLHCAECEPSIPDFRCAGIFRYGVSAAWLSHLMSQSIELPNRADFLPLHVTTSASRARLAATYSSDRSRSSASGCSSSGTERIVAAEGT